MEKIILILGVIGIMCYYISYSIYNTLTSKRSKLRIELGMEELPMLLVFANIIKIVSIILIYISLIIYMVKYL